MIAELHVYGNPSSQEPTKIYPLYRITPHTWSLVQDFIDKKFTKEEMLDNTTEVVKKKYADYSMEEINQEAARFLNIFFPEINEEEISMLDYGDGSGNNGQFYEFVNAINNYGNRESDRSLKN